MKPEIKEEKTQPKASRRKKMVKFIGEISEIENRNQ